MDLEKPPSFEKKDLIKDNKYLLRNRSTSIKRALVARMSYAGDQQMIARSGGVFTIWNELITLADN